MSNLALAVSALADMTTVLAQVSFHIASSTRAIQKAQQEGRDLTEEEMDQVLNLFQSSLNDLKETIKQKQ